MKTIIKQAFGTMFALTSGMAFAQQYVKPESVLKCIKACDDRTVDWHGEPYNRLYMPPCLQDGAMYDQRTGGLLNYTVNIPACSGVKEHFSKTSDKVMNACRDKARAQGLKGNAYFKFIGPCLKAGLSAE